MAFTNTKESGLEALIVKWLVDQNGYEQGTNADYNREYAVDETRLFRFLQDTQPDALEKLGVFKSDMKKKQFLNRLQGEIAKRGIIDVLRNGVKIYPANLIMFYLTPTENNTKAKEMFEKNIFSVTRQLQYSMDATRLALDICLFINGLPVITFELKNQLTKQDVDDAVEQYKTDRDPRELLFQFKRCMVHFAVDDARIKFCTKLDGKNSWFLPFDKGYNDGAGNPPNPDGLMTDYLWKDILTKLKLSRIIENYAQVVVEEDPETKKKSVKQIFPRYHQLDCVEKLLADVKENGIGKRYLIQHSAGSGKSNSISWLAHQLIGLEQDGHPMIDSVLVVTDRRILDKQIRDIITDHYEWFTDEYTDQEDFRRWRNSVGALLLLHKSINASLNDSRYGYKLSKYCSNEGNIYTESLGQLAYQNNPKFKKFITDNNLDFKAYDQFGKAEITERVALLVQLVNLVWNGAMFE